MHGKIDKIRIQKYNKIFVGLPSEISATRYNSLVVDAPSQMLSVDAISLTDGEIMAISHVEWPIFGVQFHPESVGTPYGRHILRNFLNEV
jgi:anthranilate synthase component 2